MYISLSYVFGSIAPKHSVLAQSPPPPPPFVVEFLVEWVEGEAFGTKGCVDRHCASFHSAGYRRSSLILVFVVWFRQ